MSCLLQCAHVLQFFFKCNLKKKQYASNFWPFRTFFYWIIFFFKKNSMQTVFGRTESDLCVCVVLQSLDGAANRSQEFSWNPTVRSRSLLVRSDLILNYCVSFRSLKFVWFDIIGGEWRDVYSTPEFRMPLTVSVVWWL